MVDSLGSRGYGDGDPIAPGGFRDPPESQEPHRVLRRLKLTDFKNFHEAELTLGPLTVIVGANAAGKSNIRDAFRFLHGISRGYSVAEIIGEKWGEGGELVWRGIRGGTREVFFGQTVKFGIEVDFVPIPDNSLVIGDSSTLNSVYGIEIGVTHGGQLLTVNREFLRMNGKDIFNSHPSQSTMSISQDSPVHVIQTVRPIDVTPAQDHRIGFTYHKPALTQMLDRKIEILGTNRLFSEAATNSFASMRFLDLSPEAMRTPSLPGQTILGDAGGNLSSVLMAICEDPTRKATLLEWVRALTPMDASDFEFLPDAAGRVLLMLVERSGLKISALSASDGTLRFLAMLAALLGPQAASFYFFEELENGIHPARLHLLLQLIESQVATNPIQIIATTHSPDLLTLLSDKSLESASLVYRAEGEQQGRIVRILDIPGAAEQVRKRRLGDLHASGWLENAVAFAADSEAA